MRNVSDQYGRALEYRLVYELINCMPNDKVKLTDDAIRDQRRDKEKFEALDGALKADYEKCARDVFRWLNLKFSIQNKEIVLHRLTDQEGRRGDPTDIRLILHSQEINLSIKHRHDAVKHQRPPSTAQWCGYERGSSKDLEFRRKYESVTKEFLQDATELLPRAKNFRDLKAYDRDFINNNLYQPVCVIVCDFINHSCNTTKSSEHLFRFLVGRTDFYKIVNRGRETNIYKFIDIPSPESVEAKCHSSNYVLLRFSNGWEMAMRIHTAASVLGTSIKFDTQASNLDQLVPIERI